MWVKTVTRIARSLKKAMTAPTMLTLALSLTPTQLRIPSRIRATMVSHKVIRRRRSPPAYPLFHREYQGHSKWRCRYRRRQPPSKEMGQVSALRDALVRFVLGLLPPGP